MTSVYPYPHIPDAAQDKAADTLTGPFASEPFSVERVVLKTSSQEWGDHAAAIARSTIEPIVTAENEALFRTYHPALAPVTCVMAVRLRRSEPYIWVVVLQPDTNTSLIGTHAGDREIHFRPGYISPIRVGVPMAGPPGPMRLPVNVRRMLTAKDLNDIRLHWPKSIGIRILISGVALLIYANENDISYDIDRCPISFGELDVGYMVQDHVPAAEASQPTVDVGQAVAHAAAAAPPLSVLGLRLRLPNGVEAITVATHAFASTSISSMGHFAYHLNSAKNTLSKLLPFTEADAKVRGTVTYNSPLGKAVWLAGTNTKIGRIEYTYDEPHPFQPYPAGYKHDLSLVVGQLPDIAPPWDVQEMQWAEYQEALDNAGSAFVCRFNTANSDGAARCGHTSPEGVRKAVLEGTEYLWDRENMSSTAALIWRTTNKSSDVGGWSGSGSALCLGNPSARAVKVVVFQNFQFAMRKDGTDLNPKGSTTFETFQGGFVLPLEIRESEIMFTVQSKTNLGRTHGYKQKESSSPSSLP